MLVAHGGWDVEPHGSAVVLVVGDAKRCEKIFLSALETETRDAPLSYRFDEGGELSTARAVVEVIGVTGVGDAERARGTWLRFAEVEVGDLFAIELEIIVATDNRVFVDELNCEPEPECGVDSAKLEILVGCASDGVGVVARATWLHVLGELRVRSAREHGEVGYFQADTAESVASNKRDDVADGGEVCGLGCGVENESAVGETDKQFLGFCALAFHNSMFGGWYSPALFGRGEWFRYCGNELKRLLPLAAVIVGSLLY